MKGGIEEEAGKAWVHEEWLALEGEGGERKREAMRHVK